MASAQSELPVPSLEQQMDSMPLVDEDAVEISDEEARRVAAAQPLPAAHELEFESNGFTTQIPHETRIESMPSSGIGSPSAGPACESAACLLVQWNVDSTASTQIAATLIIELMRCLASCFWPLVDAALDTDLSPDEAEERERLIQQVMELQNTLGGLSYLFLLPDLLVYPSVEASTNT